MATPQASLDSISKQIQAMQKKLKIDLKTVKDRGRRTFTFSMHMQLQVTYQISKGGVRNGFSGNETF